MLKVEASRGEIRTSREKKDGSIIEITSNSSAFVVRSSVLIHALGKEAHGMRDDRHYYAVGKRGAKVFYEWMSGHLREACEMTIDDLKETWHILGVRWDCA